MKLDARPQRGRLMEGATNSENLALSNNILEYGAHSSWRAERYRTDVEENAVRQKRIRQCIVVGCRGSRDRLGHSFVYDTDRLAALERVRVAGWYIELDLNKPFNRRKTSLSEIVGEGR